MRAHAHRGATSYVPVHALNVVHAHMHVCACTELAQFKEGSYLLLTMYYYDYYLLLLLATISLLPLNACYYGAGARAVQGWQLPSAGGDGRPFTLLALSQAGLVDSHGRSALHYVAARGPHASPDL